MRSSVLDTLAEQLAGQVDALAGLAVDELSVPALQQLIATATAQAERLAGVASRALGQLEVASGGLVPDDNPADTVCSSIGWLRAVTRTGSRQTGRAVRTAVALRELPEVADAVVAGTVSLGQAQALTRLVGRIEPGALLECQSGLIELCGRYDAEQLGCYVSHLIATWCEPAQEADERAAEAKRYLQLRDNHDGSWAGRFRLSAAAMEIVRSVLEPLARRDGVDDCRSAGQRRADAMTDVFAMAQKYGDLPEAGGARPRLTYLVPAGWAGAGWDAAERPAAGPSPTPDGRPDFPPNFPADLPTDLPLGPPPLPGGLPGPDQPFGLYCATGTWTGPATRAAIATAACDAEIERLTLTADGQIVSLSAVGDQITRAQRRAISARDRHCVARGCTRGPAYCDVHHIRARADGGPTTVENMTLLCKCHHLCWHRGAITVADLRVPWLAQQRPPPRGP